MQSQEYTPTMFIRGNQRGIALLIVLLVTALLVALVFEFAYATRISMNNAVNFRDSQRAYYYARSGIRAFMRLPKLRDDIPQGVWSVVPMISGGDTEVRIKWEDEGGKIKITDVKTDPPTQPMVRNLLENAHIDTTVYDRLTDQATSEVNRIGILSGIHAYMTDEEYGKVADFLTVSTVSAHRININTAPKQVLESMGIPPGTVDLIIQDRERTAYKDLASVPGIADIKLAGVNISSYLTVGPSTVFKVYCNATVGGYTRVAEAIVSGSQVSYWRIL